MNGIKKTPIIQLLVIVMFFPLLMGQEGCPVSQDIMDNDIITNLLQTKITQHLKKGQKNIYVTELSFIDAKTRTTIPSRDSALFVETIFDVIEQVSKLNSAIKLNAPDHTIKDTSGNVNKLI
jgi:hypothetical protein